MRTHAEGHALLFDERSTRRRALVAVKTVHLVVVDGRGHADDFLRELLTLGTSVLQNGLTRFARSAAVSIPERRNTTYHPLGVKWSTILSKDKSLTRKRSAWSTPISSTKRVSKIPTDALRDCRDAFNSTFVLRNLKHGATTVELRGS